MERDIESLVLTYRNEYKMEFQYYTEFLRYIGIYVYEDFRCNEKDNADFKEDKESALSVSYVVNKKIKFDDETERRKCLQEFLQEIFGKCTKR